MRTGALLVVFGVLASVQGADVSVPGGVLRVEKNSQIRITDGQVELTRGTIIYQVQNAGAAAQVEILTPSVAAKAGEDGVYRIVIRKTGESEITAQSGRMVVIAPSGEQWLEAGQRMIARGPRGNPQFRMVSTVAWWKRLAGLFQNMQIGLGGGGTSEQSGGEDDRKTTAAKETHTKPQAESAAVPSGSAHASSDRAKTSDGQSHPTSGSAHSGDSRPTGNNGGGSTSRASGSQSAPASSSSHSSENHAGPAPASHSSDNGAKGK